MVAESFSAGLTIWSGAIFRLAAGLAFTLSLIVVAYAAVISFSPSGAVTLVATALLASLALAGWWRFCGRIAADGETRVRDLVAGFVHPVRGLVAGAAPATLVGAPAWAVHTWLAPWLRSPAGDGLALAAGLSLAPWALAVPFAAMAHESRLPSGLRLNWFGGLAVCILVAAVAALGPMTWLLLEENATDILAAHLPAALAPYGLGAVRSAGLIVVLLSASAASCVWAASYWLTRIR